MVGRTLTDAEFALPIGRPRGLGMLKDIRGSNVNEPDVEPTDNPVITSDVTASGLAKPTSAVRPLIEAAFDAHAGRLKGFALASVRDEDAADDLVQETFLH